jgi:phosphate starvation-inducible protein PhoH and related proteins
LTKLMSKNAPSFHYNGDFFGLHLDEDQINFIKEVWNPMNLVVFCNAVSGTGKTVLSVGMAEVLYKKGLYKNGIKYVAAPYGLEKQGFLKGDIQQKSEVYYEPLYQALETLGLSSFKVVKDTTCVINKKYDEAYIECVPNTFLRGQNFSECIVIIDEAQNNTKEQLKTILTRCHDSCKVIVVGHTGQQDMLGLSGFLPYLNWYKDEAYCGICELSVNHRGKISRKADALE